MHVRKCFRENTIGFKNLCHCCFSPSATWPFPSPPPLPCLLGVLFNPKLPLLSWSVPSDVQFSPQSLWLTWSMSVSWDARLLCHVMSIYFLKITPSTTHSSDNEPNSTYIFFFFFAFDDDDDDYLYFFSSAVHCYENHYCRISFQWIFFLCSTCCTETFQSHPPFLPSPPPQLKSSGPFLVLLLLSCKRSCYRESPWNHSLP